MVEISLLTLFVIYVLSMKKHQRNMTDFIKEAYYAYFGVEMGKDNWWVPHKGFYICQKYVMTSLTLFVIYFVTI